MNSVRVICGYIEVNGVRFAQILPGMDERTLREEIEGSPHAIEEAREEGSIEGFEAGKAEGYEEGKQELNNSIENALEKLLKDGEITEEIHDLLCERLPSE